MKRERERSKLMHQNNVRYTYGDNTATYNQRGRIALLEDASGFQTFKYGRMGEVIENNHTFVLPNESHQYSFRMQYSYDSWNRVQYITYPDGEVVHYRYNTGGMLDTVYGKKVVSGISPKGGIGGGGIVGPIIPDPIPSTTYTYYYINHTTYNEFELKSGQWYGNGTQAQYSYDILQRLENLKLYDNYRPRHLLQDITYTYDKASNIDTIRNAATTVSTLGGRYTYTYQYDSLYRLTGGAGNFANLKPLANYALSMTYAADGRILRKTQNGTTRLNGRAANFNTDISYTYNSRRPHTLYSAGGKAYTWNANGNLLSEGDPLIATRKYLQLAWDEENRMLSADMPQAHTCAIYAYDADGERFYRNVGSRTEMTQNGQTYVYRRYGDPVLYPSPYVVCTPQGYTKHYFVESERLASRLGDGTISGLNNHVANAAALAAKQAKVNAAAPDSIVPNRFAILRQLQAHWSNHHTTYWQHGDHLGSASWITDTNGMGYQHLQYMPWGEPLVDQRVSGATYRSRYTFSGKERDEETGFSYFGSRYYNSNLSIWLSVDPMSDKYPGVSPYVYCGNNTVVLKDPNGREIGKYFDLEGNYLGWDGVVDKNVYFVSGSIPNENIDENTRIISSLGDAKITISTTEEVIAETLLNATKTANNGETREEGTFLTTKGRYTGQGPDISTIPINKPANVEVKYEGDIITTIHSHLMGYRNVPNSKEIDFANALKPSKADLLITAKQNIITGPLGEPEWISFPCGGGMWQIPVKGAVFYDSNWKYQGDITIGNLQKVNAINNLKTISAIFLNSPLNK